MGKALTGKLSCTCDRSSLTLLHSEILYAILAFLSAVGLKDVIPHWHTWEVTKVVSLCKKIETYEAVPVFLKWNFFVILPYSAPSLDENMPT